MLIDVSLKSSNDPILKIVSLLHKKSDNILKLKTGMYLSTYWNFENATYFKLDCYPQILEIGNLGVCDYPDQLIEKFPILETDPRKFVISFVHIEKENQPNHNGWRWHKWGEYIGTQNPECEYLFDEEKIKEVYTFHIYEIL